MSNNNLQFITLSFVKSHFGFTDTQDDMKLLGIVQACNLEIKKQITPVIDSLDSIEGTDLFQPCADAALVYCEAEILRQVNKKFEEAKTTMARFQSVMNSLLGTIRAAAPKRTSRLLASRDTDPEDDYFATRHTS